MAYPWEPGASDVPASTKANWQSKVHKQKKGPSIPKKKVVKPKRKV